VQCKEGGREAHCYVIVKIYEICNWCVNVFSISGFTLHSLITCSIPLKSYSCPAATTQRKTLWRRVQNL